MLPWYALPLFAWDPPAPAVAAPRKAAPSVRLLLLTGCHTVDGDPRPALLLPGRRAPVAYASMTEALAAKRAAEANL